MASSHDSDYSHGHVDAEDDMTTLTMSSHDLDAGTSIQKRIDCCNNTIDVDAEVNGATVLDPTHDLDARASLENTVTKCSNSEHKRTDDEDKEAVVELLPGKSLVVKLHNSNVRLKINHDALGYRIFGAGIENPAPMMIQRPDSFNMFLFKRHYGNTFDFFSLPGEIRNIIYGFLFRKRPKSEDHYPFFYYKKAQNPTRFFTDLNRSATGRSGLPLASRRTLHETMPFFLESRYFKFDCDRSLRIFLKSIGPHGRSIWSGPLRIFINRGLDTWQGDGRFKPNETWTSLLAECHNLRAIEITIDDGDKVVDRYQSNQSDNDPIYRLLFHGNGQFPRVDSVKIHHIMQHVWRAHSMAWSASQSLGAEYLFLLKSKITHAELEQRRDHLFLRTNVWLSSNWPKAMI